jgi:hypothetical protein
MNKIKLTQEDKNLLIESIKAAKNSRTYTVGNEPGCVIGQLAFRLGVPLESMNEWETQNWLMLQQYPTEGAQPVWEFEERTNINLHALQDSWDDVLPTASEGYVEQTRQDLISRVNSW